MCTFDSAYILLSLATRKRVAILVVELYTDLIDRNHQPAVSTTANTFWINILNSVMKKYTYEEKNCTAHIYCNIMKVSLIFN